MLLDGSTIYITHFPCINCVKDIKYANDYKDNKPGSYLLSSAGIKINKMNM